MINEPDSEQGNGRWLLALAAIVLLDRLILLSIFGFSYVGSDDLTFWQGAADYSNGIFHEPYFYGQNYNFMLEAMVAVPLLWCGVPYHIALPLCSSAMAVFPFFFFAATLHRKGRHVEAGAALLVLVALPVQYGMLTSVSRGFISGLFFSSLLVIPLLKPDGWRSFVVLSLSCSLGYLFNPNSAVVALPVALYVLLKNSRDVRYYAIMAVGSVAALWIQGVARSFYTERSDDHYYSLVDLEFSTTAMFSGFGSLDRFFSHLTPVVWPIGWLVVVVLPAIGVVLWKRDQAASIALWMGTAFVLTAMGVNKVNDAAGVLLHSSMRMYLALPLLFIVALCWWLPTIRAERFNWWPCAMGLAAIMLLVKMDVAGPVVREGVKRGENNPIATKHWKAMEWDCGRMGDTLVKYNADVLVLLPYWAKGVPEMEYLDYGCPLIDDRFERTVMNAYERRTWVFKKEMRAVHHNIMLHGAAPGLDTLLCYPELSALRIDDQTTLIRNERFHTAFVLGLLGVEFDRDSGL